MKKTQHMCTHALNEPVFLDMWIKHLSKEAPDLQLHVLLDEAVPDEADRWKATYPDVDFIVWKPRQRGNEEEILQTVENLGRTLFDQGATLFGHLDTDEFIIPTHGTLQEWLDTFVADPLRVYGIATGWQVFHDPRLEAPAFKDSPDALHDRHVCYRTVAYSKPCLAKRPITWIKGFHRRCAGGNRTQKINETADPTLDLIHMATFDLDVIVQRHLDRAKDVSKDDLNWTYGQSLNRDGWTFFLQTAVPPWDVNHPTYQAMRANGRCHLKPEWLNQVFK